jgi:hypothetical protein
MDERRRSVRQKIRLRGRVYFNDGRNWANCLIRDISYEGARIVFTNRVKIPDAFLLTIPEKNRMVHANVRWRHGNRIGSSSPPPASSIQSRARRAPREG